MPEDLEEYLPLDVLYTWQAHDVLHPLAGSGDDYRLAYLLANTMNAATGGKWSGPAQPHDRNRTPFTPQDFIIDRLPRIPVQRRRLADPRAQVDPARFAAELDALFTAQRFPWKEE